MADLHGLCFRSGRGQCDLTQLFLDFCFDASGLGILGVSFLVICNGRWRQRAELQNPEPNRLSYAE